jgi:hypothetical protein
MASQEAGTLARLACGSCEAGMKMRQEGADIFFDRDDPRKILEAGSPPESAQLESEST